MMCPEDNVQNLDAIPQNDADSEPHERVDDVDLYENDDHLGDDVQQQELLDDEVPQNIPASAPKKKRKRRTELENLEITLKGWNMATSVFQALPFTHDTAQPVGGVVNNEAAADSCNEGHQELYREGENADADKEFNFVKNDNDFDNLYLLQLKNFVSFVSYQTNCTAIFQNTHTQCDAANAHHLVGSSSYRLARCP